jgi:curved DNA-binding protein CbpA
MVNYYQVLKVSSKASNAEIKSAYRRLAWKYHPDVNDGAEDSAREFAKIAKAYEILGNPQERANYDRLILKQKYNNLSNDDSLFTSENAHARRWRQMAYDRRYNEIIDRMIADERRESLALQKVIFPTVALFLSTCFVAIFKPTFWKNSQAIGKIILLSLFVVGIVHLFKRLRSAFERYTYANENIHDSILEADEPVKKPYTRFAAISFLVGGFVLSLGIGLLIGNYFEAVFSLAFPKSSSGALNPDIFFYPPIAVLLVDLIHNFASRIEH